MRQRGRCMLIWLVAAVTLAAAGCTGDAPETPSPGEMSLADVILDPGAHLGTQVTVEGVVFEVIDDRTFRLAASDMAVGEAVRGDARTTSGTALVVADVPVDVTVDEIVEVTAEVRALGGIDPGEVFNDDELPEFALEDDPVLLASEVAVAGEVDDDPADEPEPTRDDN